MVQYKYPELKLLFHIPNGGKRDIVTAAKLKAEGVKAGVLDLCLPVPKGIYHGAFIEMKAMDGKISSEQSMWIEDLKNQGYFIAVCYGWEKARDIITSYLKPKL